MVAGLAKWINDGAGNELVSATYILGAAILTIGVLGSACFAAMPLRFWLRRTKHNLRVIPAIAAMGHSDLRHRESLHLIGPTESDGVHRFH